LKKLIFNDVRFLGKVPVFERYMTFWDRAHGIMLRGVGFDAWKRELKIVEDAEAYLVARIADEVRSSVEMMLRARELAIERTDRRLGLLFSERLADFKLSAK
jgi:hypothetical protein